MANKVKTGVLVAAVFGLTALLLGFYLWLYDAPLLWSVFPVDHALAVLFSEPFRFAFGIYVVLLMALFVLHQWKLDPYRRRADSRASSSPGPDTPYDLIDPIIQVWAEENALTLFTGFGDREARFCYKSSEKGECFQISIQKPLGTRVTVHAWSIETRGDEELHQQWKVRSTNLRMALDKALVQLDAWMNR